MASITAQCLLDKCFCPEKPMTGLDGKVASIFGEWIVTSPNADFVPEVFFGHTEVYLRVDARYGPDDATLWPQSYLDKYPHLMAIPRKPIDPYTDITALWWTPSRDDFKQSDDALIGGIGCFAGREMDIMKKLKDELLVEARAYLKDKETPVLVQSCFTTLIHSWVRLECYPDNFPEKCLEVTEFQRHWLELRAAMDYFDKLVKRMFLSTDPPEGAVEERVGCLTTQPRIAQECFSAGVPVWLLRDLKLFHQGGVRIDKVVPPCLVRDSLEVDRWSLNDFPTLYRGSPSVMDRYIVQHQFTRSRMTWKDPWENGEGPAETANPREMAGLDVTSATRTMAELESFQVQEVRPSLPRSFPMRGDKAISETRKSVHPYATSRASSSAHSSQASSKRSDGKKTALGRDKFAEPSHSLSPPHISAWAYALKKIDRGDNKAADGKRPVQTYAFPEPGLFLNTMDEERGVLYLDNWLRSRPAWLWHASRPGAAPLALRNQVWRDCLYHGIATGTQTAMGAKTAERIGKMLKTLGCRLDASGHVVVDGTSEVIGLKEKVGDTVMWKGKAVKLDKHRFPRDGIVQEVLWELYELNFRSDLLSLDRLLAPSHYSDVDKMLQRQSVLAKCFPGGDEADFQWLRPRISLANHGLGAASVGHRRNFILALAHVMTDWERVKVPLLVKYSSTRTITDEEMYHLEGAVASFYCQTYYDCRGRVPLTPHRSKPADF